MSGQVVTLNIDDLLAAGLASGGRGHQESSHGSKIIGCHILYPNVLQKAPEEGGATASVLAPLEAEGLTSGDDALDPSCLDEAFRTAVKGMNNLVPAGICIGVIGFVHAPNVSGSGEAGNSGTEEAGV